MLYAVDITIPANTSKDDPYTLDLPITAGVLLRAHIRWRWGSGNLCGIRLLWAELALLPRTLGEWIVSSPYPYEFMMEHAITDVPTSVKIEAYNLDDTYAHNVWVGLELSRGAFSPGWRWLLGELAGMT